MRIDCCVSYFQKQLIGLLPSGTECMYYYAPDVNVDGYRIDGIIYDDYTFIDSDLNPYGIYYFITFLPDSGEPRFILTYVGTEPPTYLPAITDNNGDPVTWGWTTCCTKVCLEMTINENDYIYFKNGYGYVCFSQTTGFDDQIPMETLLKSLYGQQTTYTAVYNPSDATFFVTIDNAYVCNPPLAWSGDNVTYTDMVPCGTPPAATCLFSVGKLGDSTGDNCFTTPGWDFNGQGVDFTAAANIYGGYAVNDGNTTSLPYGADTCSSVTFIYIGNTSPVPVNVTDPIFGALQFSFVDSYCSYGCLTTNSILLKDTYYGIAMLGLIDVPFTSYGVTSIDFVNDLVTAEAVLGALISKYYPGSVVNVTADGADNFTITFNNIYYNPLILGFLLIDSSGTPIIITTLVPC